MSMGINTVGELREELEGLDEDMPVRCVVQPSYPMFASVEQTQVFEQGDEDDEPGQKYFALRISDNEAYGAPRDEEWW